MHDLKQTVLENQRLAADPSYNVWVNASAGSGKTKVLIDRILRLLLSGAKPSSILCITFTKAAALEMQARLQGHLERWVMASDAELSEALKALDVNLKLSEQALFNARRLYNQVLDDPVQIQTIHSFAQQILQGAGETAGIPFGIDLAPEVLIHKIVHLTVSQVLIKEDLSQIHKLFSRSKFNDIVQAILQDRAFFRFVLMDGVSAFKIRLSEYLQQPRSESEIQDDVVGICEALNVDVSRLHQHTLASDKDKQWLESLQHALSRKTIDALCPVLLTTQGTPRKRLISKKLGEAFSAELNALECFAADILERDQELKRLNVLRCSSAVVEFAAHFFSAYAAEKRMLGVWDYDDLIFTALELLSDLESADVVLSQLGQRIDHILVDEAQDTNMYQWKLLDGLIQGVLQREEHATVFVVGDHKQSIFGFQGTDPDIFHMMQSYYQNQPSHRGWKQIELDISFRTLQGVLDKVDQIFNSVKLVENYRQHSAFRGEGGVFNIHPLIPISEESEPLRSFVAEIADEIERYISVDQISPSDIMLLIRRRGEHLDAIQEALKQRKIPFSSPNRKLLHEDVLVNLILRFMVLIHQPRDQENILQLLLNPLLNVGERVLTWGAQSASELENLMQQLHSVPIVARLLSGVGASDSFDQQYQAILSILVRELPVTSENITNAGVFFDLYQENLKLKGTSFLPEVLHQATSLPQTQAASAQSDALQVMTVHGAKGLQSKVVMLIDTIQTPSSRYALLKEDEKHLVLCAEGRSFEPDIYFDLKEKQRANELREYYRLLYVALTRAEDDAHIWGIDGKSISDGSWYRVCEMQKG